MPAALFFALLLAFTPVAKAGNVVLVGLPGPDKLVPPSIEPAVPRSENGKLGVKRPRIFGVGVGFERTGSGAGVALNIVLPDSPAWRAGLVTGGVISEINGQPTAGRSGDECAQMIRDGGVKVRLTYRDAAWKQKTVLLEKDWIAVPE